MSKINRLNGCTDWIDLGVMEQQRTLRLTMKLGIQLQLAELLLSNTVSVLGKLGVEQLPKTIYDWVQKADDSISVSALNH